MTQQIDVSNDNKLTVSEIALFEVWNMLASMNIRESSHWF